MATMKIYPKELKNVVKMYKDYQLCYVDSIPETYLDYTPESFKLIETEEYKEYHRKRREYLDDIMKRQGSCSSRDWEEYDWEHDPGRRFKTELQDYPTEDIIDGYTHYLYFTNNLKEQWGDDWDDAPYEYNAEVPYDHDTEILQVPICLDYFKLLKGYANDEEYEIATKDYPNFHNVEVKFPRDWGGANSPFCIMDVNAGAVAWIFATLSEGRYVTESIAIHAGENPQKVMKKIKEINKLLKKKKDER